MFSSYIISITFILSIEQTVGLVELPHVDDNNILSTEVIIRKTINTLFYSLKLRGIKNRTRLKEFSTVHNHLVSFTLQDYKNLKEIAKLTRVDKRKINNETSNFMTVINELLDEDIDVDKIEFVTDNDESVIGYVEQFLVKLQNLKEEFGVNNKTYKIKDDIYQVLKENDFASYNYTMDYENSNEFVDNDTLLDESDFWSK